MKKCGIICLKKGTMSNIAAYKKDKKQSISLAINILIVIAEILGLILSIKPHGWGMYKYYTQDSNLFALIVCAIYSVHTVLLIKNKISEIPKWLRALKYIATCCLAVTLIVVIFILAPMSGEGGLKVFLFSGSMLYYHLICPVAAIIVFIFFEEGLELNTKNAFLAMIPTITYAAIFLTLNIMKVLEGPYPFLYVYEQPFYMSVIWFVVILGGAYFIAWLTLFANARSMRKT
jgi:hypothetical protein